MMILKRRRLVRGGAVLAVLSLTGWGVLTALSSPGESNAAAASTVWADEFDGPAGSAPDSKKWRSEVKGDGFGNNELQYYTGSTDNIALDGQGNLVITAKKGNPSGLQCWNGPCQYTSGKLTTASTFTRTYGHFEARIKIPRGQGIWPAFWMLGNDIGSAGWPKSGEIDIMENVGKEPGKVHGSLHGPGYSGGNPLTGTYTLPQGKALADDFHVYSVDWSPGLVVWKIDGTEYSRKTTADAGSNKWVFDHPFFMMLNLAVGGNWPGSPDASTTFPQRMVIDYVRVTDATQGGSNGGSQTPSPTVPSDAKAVRGLDGKCLDVNAAETANGTKIQVYGCNGTPAQKWSSAAHRSLRALDKCLDVKAGGTADGTAIQLYECNGTPAQEWVLSNAGDLVNPQADKCLDIKDRKSADRTPVQLWTCKGTTNQKWKVSAS
ncbi:MAG: hypothetical protein QG608_2009 [Actinomycetota bacterium]|nr:hypothetical protein [Actinomycetota bacterium]